MSELKVEAIFGAETRRPLVSIELVVDRGANGESRLAGQFTPELAVLAGTRLIAAAVTACADAAAIRALYVGDDRPTIAQLLRELRSKRLDVDAEERMP